MYFFYKILKTYRKYFGMICSYLCLIMLKSSGVEGKVVVKGYCLFDFSSGSSIVIEDNVFLVSSPFSTISDGSFLEIKVQRKGKLFIGMNFGISPSSVHVWESIHIGSYVNIGAGCLIMDTDFHSLDPILRSSPEGGEPGQYVRTCPIEIEDYAFIGARSIIGKGVTIGENSIIASGSVVVKSVPKNEVWGGNPAKFIRKI